MIYAWRARDPLKRIVEGELEAADPDRLKREIAGRGLELLSFRPVRESRAPSVSAARASAPDDGRPAAQPEEFPGRDAFAEDPVDLARGGGAASRVGATVRWGILLYILFNIAGIFSSCLD